MIEGSCRSRRTGARWATVLVIEGSCRSRPALEELDGQQFFAIEGLKLLMVPHRVLESAIFHFLHRVLLARAGPRSCRPWSSTKFPQQIKLRLHLDREGTRHLEGQMASVATQIFDVRKWSKVRMLKLLVKRRCPSQSRCSQWLSPGNSPQVAITGCRKVHIRQRTHEHRQPRRAKTRKDGDRLSECTTLSAEPCISITVALTFGSAFNLDICVT